MSLGTISRRTVSMCDVVRLVPIYASDQIPKLSGSDEQERPQLGIGRLSGEGQLLGDLQESGQVLERGTEQVLVLVLCLE